MSIPPVGGSHFTPPSPNSIPTKQQMDDAIKALKDAQGTPAYAEKLQDLKDLVDKIPSVGPTPNAKSTFEYGLMEAADGWNENAEMTFNNALNLKPF